jgi:hypothetical protein
VCSHMQHSLHAIIGSYGSMHFIIQCVRSVYASVDEKTIGIYLQDNNSNAFTHGFFASSISVFSLPWPWGCYEYFSFFRRGHP